MIARTPRARRSSTRSPSPSVQHDYSGRPDRSQSWALLSKLDASINATILRG
jgi:hypothetical protein